MRVTSTFRCLPREGEQEEENLIIDFFSLSSLSYSNYHPLLFSFSLTCWFTSFNSLWHRLIMNWESEKLSSFINFTTTSAMLVNWHCFTRFSFFSVEIQAPSVQNAQPRRASTARLTLALELAAVPGVHKQRPGGENLQNVCQRTRPELPLSGDGRDAARDGDKREKAPEAADCFGQWRRAAGLQNKRWKHATAQGRRER